jgi:membrane protein YqaA with SNARE-associated domain
VTIEEIQAIVDALVHNPIFVKYGLVGLFLNGFLSSVIPIPTELVTSAILASGEPKLNVFIVLSIASIVGGFLAYYIGRGGGKLLRHFYKKPKEKDSESGHKFLAKYGWIGIFFCSWIPIFGDAVPIVAGAKKYDFTKFALAMSAGKTVKVAAIVYVFSLLIPRIFGI